ncbi:MAG TPA: hypothetical protein VMR37_02045 [Rhabdochlamydiaceae bacterium]|nr:hypothetical protein [Rhabdochlamydiaceae bacterium]
MSKIDVKVFAEQWWSQVDLNYHFDLRQWMQKSYSDPLSFWEDLFTLYPIEPSSQTIPLQKYDFYADCILRHQDKNTTALKVIKADRVETWSYQQIHEIVDAQASLWKQSYRLEAGKTVVLVLPQGLPFLIGLMTALRLGLIICILPFNDPFFPKSQLMKAVKTVDPDLIVTTFEKQFNEEWDILNLDLSLEKQSAGPVETHAYLANDIVFKHFNPYRPEKERISLLEAMRSYLIPLRDSLLALNLKQSMAWARPFSSMFREEPCCTLMALLAGATIVYVSDELLKSNPALLKEQSIDVLGISPLLQQLWIKNPGCPSSKLKLWYRDPLCGNDHNWKAFNELNRLQKVPACQLIIDKERGGTILFSQPKSLDMVTFLHPSLGMSWNLLKIQGSGDPAVSGFGLFHIEPANKDRFILAQIGDEWTISGSTVPFKEGYPYPLQEVEEAVKTLDFVLTCMIVAERHPQHFLSQQFILLVFVSPKEHLFIQQKKEEWTRKIHEIIQTEVGEAFVPGEVLVYSFYPKMENKKIDRNWIETQHQNGSLYLKQNRPLYHFLNLLRQSTYENMTYKK